MGDTCDIVKEMYEGGSSTETITALEQFPFFVVSKSYNTMYKISLCIICIIFDIDILYYVEAK